MNAADRAERLAAWIRNNGGRVARRDILKRHIAGIRTASELAEVLDAYAERWPGTVRLATAEEHAGKAGKPGLVVLAPQESASPPAPPRASVTQLVMQPRPDRQDRIEPTHRIALNLPVSSYRQLQRWADDAAETLDRPRVGIQDALRAMIQACLTDPGSHSAALAQIDQRDADPALR